MIDHIYSIEEISRFVEPVALVVVCGGLPFVEVGADSYATSGGVTIDLSDENPPESGTGWTYDSSTGVYTIQNGEGCDGGESAEETERKKDIPSPRPRLQESRRSELLRRVV
jgi:hypothetical protein